MSEPRIIDISQTLRVGMPNWPGEPEFAYTRKAEISDDCPVNTGEVVMSTHAGTHADAPLHYHAEGVDSARSDLAAYIGECAVVDARNAIDAVKIEDIDWDELAGAKRVLFRTYDRVPRAAWDHGFSAIDHAVVDRLGQQGAVLIGTDTPSLDPMTSKTMDAHHAVRRQDMRILEGLVLDHVAEGRYELVALPLPIEGADASPVRAILRELA